MIRSFFILQVQATENKPRTWPWLLRQPVTWAQFYTGPGQHGLMEPPGSQAGRAPQGTAGKHVLVPTVLAATREEDAHLGNGSTPSM